MRKLKKFHIHNYSSFKNNLLFWLTKNDSFCYLNSNNFNSLIPNDNSSNFIDIIAVGQINKLSINNLNTIFNDLNNFIYSCNDWVFGYFGYDLKNIIEDLNSNNSDNIKLPDIYFYQPEYVFKLTNDCFTIEYYNDDLVIESIFEEINNTKTLFNSNLSKNNYNIESRISKQEYIDIINKLKQHICIGDIYEINFCQEFYIENIEINPLELYLNLCKLSPMPFSVFSKINNTYVLSASPERFMKKVENKIISQPMKGTIKNSNDKAENEELKNNLFNNPKERSENIMIVDLVRNDLSKTAKRNSVKVDELCGIYSYRNIQQMISTVSSEMDGNFTITDVIKNAFPMGSMTGAPKVKAMELIEIYEKTKRGLFSGSFGYFTPEKDFDFNVVIRSILYNTNNKYISYQVGSAITSLSNAIDEYDECLLKAKAFIDSFKL